MEQNTARNDGSSALQQALQPKQQVGVADYFAILGVGEELVWKHALKQQPMGMPEQPAEEAAEAAEEDDARLLERFYREIVDCTIWVADESTDHSMNAASQHPTTLVYTNHHQPHHPQTSSQAGAQQPKPHGMNMPMISPSPSDVTSAVGTEVETVEMEGWSVVQQTRPIPAAIQPKGDDMPPLWTRGQIWEANLEPVRGLSGVIRHLEVEQQRQRGGRRKASTPLKDLRERVQSSFQQRLVAFSNRSKKKFFLSFRRRAPDESTRRAIADLQLFYVQIHKASIDQSHLHQRGDAGSVATSTSASLAGASTVSQKGAAALLRVAEAGKQTFQSRVLGAPNPAPSISAQNSMDYGESVALDSLLEGAPEEVDEWSIPAPYRQLRFPSHPPPPETPFKTLLFSPKGDQDMDGSSAGIEAVEGDETSLVSSPSAIANWQERLRPKLLPADTKKEIMEEEEEEYIFVPILAIRRQRIGEEERFHEDAAIVDMAVSFFDAFGRPMIPYEEVDPFEEEEKDAGMSLLEMTDWCASSPPKSSSSSGAPRGRDPWDVQKPVILGSTCLLVRRNIPLGFCDAAFSTSVLDRFPYKNYKGLPLPEEELPMFCYPTGCRLHRAKFSDAPLPQYYGFVVKNERGDSIYVSCVSFMEPLTRQKHDQLTGLSKRRQRVSLPHAKFWAKHQRRHQRTQGSSYPPESDYSRNLFHLMDEDENGDCDAASESNLFLTGFDEMTTFENKTICLVSRYPYWTAFRRFLSHLHNVSGSSSDLPLERYISHLLLAVPIPKPGGPSLLIPLPSFSVPMMMWSPPLKDLPLLDLPYERLVSCLDVPTIVTIVLGFLALERKVIVMSTRPSLVLDVCELLRSLLFPFDLCAPYVPRLTEPFMSCLDFPGAIFVGIHDDGSPTGLAAVVRQNMPEDSTIVDLDSGSVDCSGDRMTVLNQSWGVIPPGPRSVLVSEIETLCRDAGIVPGQEPLDSLVDPSFEATMPSTPVQDFAPLGDENKEPLDDRAIRDAFLRFFCSILGGYERFLVVPDVDFLISGNEWFDAKGFLGSASEEKAAFLGSLVSTQLFQSFIQRRTEASDVHCLLFDECLAEYHSASVPYGRLGGDVETIQSADSDHPQLLYSLLVDQSATEPTNSSFATDKSFDASSRPGSDTDSNGYNPKAFFNSSEIHGYTSLRHSDCVRNGTGDWVTMPSRDGLQASSRFIYCIDGNPTFPDRLNPNSYLPRQPESWLVEMSTAPTPMLTRSDQEIEEAERRRKLATSYRGLQTQRRCLWQLPKLMGSHFLGAWLICIPALVSQPALSHEQQSKYLLRALGALRLLRSKQRIVPDEAAYRSLIVACGRTRNDRRVELVKLFGLLRSDGIFPSAVTLGQYTKALAEGYSKQRSTGHGDEDAAGSEVGEFASRDLRFAHSLHGGVDPETALGFLDGNLANLEESGRRWRHKSAAEKEATSNKADGQPSKDNKGFDRNRKKTSKLWLPVVFSSAFSPSRYDETTDNKSKPLSMDQIRLVAVWSRATACGSCGYIPLEEEVQAGWDVLGGENDVPGAINCPRCGELMLPRLGYKEFSVNDAIAAGEATTMAGVNTKGDGDAVADFASLPPQIRRTIDDTDGSYVTYISPATLRSGIERHIQEHGEEILERDKLKTLDPEIYYNLWWYCARFSLPLPLPVGSIGDDMKHYCLFAGWDFQIALRGCISAATVLNSIFEANLCSPLLVSEGNQDSGGGSIGNDDPSSNSIEAFGDYPLLARFNLQGYYATVWDQEDMSEILVALVEACDRRDFRPVVECLLRANKRRRDKYGSACSLASASSNAGNSDFGNTSLSLLPTRSEGESTGVQHLGNVLPQQTLVELECYRTALYLAKYQCTTAFHAFFPTTLKPCKGYHFWCPIATLPIFDRLLHEAIKRVRAKSNSYAPFHDVSDVALGFRSVFGHLV